MKKTITKIILFLFVLLANYSAKAQENVPLDNLFDSLEAKKMLSLGKATINGVAYRGRKGLLGDGTIKTLANKKVYLVPFTKHFEEWYKKKY